MARETHAPAKSFHSAEMILGACSALALSACEFFPFVIAKWCSNPLSPLIGVRLQQEGVRNSVPGPTRGYKGIATHNLAPGGIQLDLDLAGGETVVGVGENER